MKKFNLDGWNHIDDPLFSSFWTEEGDIDQPFVKRWTFSVNKGRFRSFIDDNFLHENIDIPFDDYRRDYDMTVIDGKMDLRAFPELYEKVKIMEDRILEIKLLLQDLHPTENGEESTEYRDLKDEMMSLIYLLKPFNTITWINPLDYKESREIFELAFSQGLIDEETHEIYKDALSDKPFYIYGCTSLEDPSYRKNNEAKRYLPFGLYKKCDPYNDNLHPSSLCTLLDEEEFEKVEPLTSYSLEFTDNPKAPKWPNYRKEEYYFPHPLNMDFPEEDVYWETNFSNAFKYWINYYKERKEKDEEILRK